MKEVMTSKEVSEYLGIGIRTVYKMVKERTIPSIKVHKRWLFPKASIDRWLQEGAESDLRAMGRAKQGDKEV